LYFGESTPGEPPSTQRNMKALIFYDEIASALKTSNSLQSIGHTKEIKTDWEINLWHTGVLRYPSVADSALKTGAYADLIVFAGSQANLLRPWTIQWLERWALTRFIEHAVLALAGCQFTDVCPQVAPFELSKFASRHNIAFIACGNEMNQLDNCGQISPWHDRALIGVNGSTWSSGEGASLDRETEANLESNRGAHSLSFNLTGTMA
jgi:hypothetical protein